MKPYVWERKYELDSLCYPVKLTYQYYQETKDQSLFDEKYLHFIHTILNIIELEQKHSENSTYTFERDIAKTWDLRKTETLQNHGHGFDTRYTGMTWSAFRPSDDACTFNYNIPGNMFCKMCIRDRLKKVQWNIQLGQTIKAESLIKNIEDRSQTEVYFYDEKSKQKSKSKSYNVEGSYIEKIVVEDEHGNQSSALRVKIVVEANKVLPEINGVKAVSYTHLLCLIKIN